GQRGVGEWNCEFVRRARCCSQRSLSVIAIQNDVLDNTNLVVNTETDGRRKPSQCHEIATLSEQLHRDKRDEHRYVYHESRHDSRAPVPQEKPDDERRQKQSDYDGIADTGNGLLHDIGLVVEGPDLDAGRQAWTRSEEHTSELQSRSDLVCRLL